VLPHHPKGESFVTDNSTQLVIDKATWGEGPWQSEPDRAEWRHAGLPCLALRNQHGAWCGYVAVPPGHSLHGKPYDDADVSVHGGLTYANRCSGHICHTPQPDDSDDVWWFGFDCLHGGDFGPAMHARMRDLGSPYADEPYDHAKAVAAHSFFVDVYRTLDYVRAETNALAEQLGAQWGGTSHDLPTR
jgi:hypothetical protein